MSVIPISACSLHVPYKEWSTSHEEKTNYDVLERWGQQILSCYAIGRHVGGGSVFSATNRSWFSGNVTVPNAVTVHVDFTTLTRTDSLGTNITLPAPGNHGYTLGANGLLFVVADIQYPGPFTHGNEINNTLADFNTTTNFNFGGQPAVNFILQTSSINTTHTHVFGLGGGYYMLHDSGDTMDLQLSTPLAAPLTVVVNMGVTLMELA